MREPILVLNARSLSVKFSVIETSTEPSLSAGPHGQVQGIGASGRLSIADRAGRKLAEQRVTSRQNFPRIGSHRRSWQRRQLCAVNRGRSLATTMAFTAIDGLPMGTRCGAGARARSARPDAPISGRPDAHVAGLARVNKPENDGPSIVERI
jgi:hypothetical protein